MRKYTVRMYNGKYRYVKAKNMLSAVVYAKMYFGNTWQYLMPTHSKKAWVNP